MRPRLVEREFLVTQKPKAPIASTPPKAPTPPKASTPPTASGFSIWWLVFVFCVVGVIYFGNWVQEQQQLQHDTQQPGLKLVLPLPHNADNTLYVL
jgi:hypothetical protein